ncbi:MAG TPA: hypothetical protein VMN82_17690 [Thermoanaerobaculia bacterium]|nr:hypothetical protein [Thermoanaerobaculia bacterium]
MKRSALWLSASVWGLALASVASAQPAAIPIPGGDKGVGFDDLRWSPALRRLIVPAAGTGSIVLWDPRELAQTQISGLGEAEEYRGGYDAGVTSADEGRGFVFAGNRTSRRLIVVDPKDGRVVSSGKLGGSPDYVRWVEPTGEIWVTEPEEERIEVFRLDGNPPKPVHEDFIAVKGGPESLVVDVARARVYTHLWKGKTVALTLKNRGVAATWPNGCDGSRGIALDPDRGFLFAGCAEGAAAVLDARDGRLLSKLRVGEGVDLIDYSPRLSHLYLAAGKSATLPILLVSATGALELAGEVPTAAGGHCVAADESGNAYVCDPKAGRLLVVRDPFGP